MLPNWYQHAVLDGSYPKEQGHLFPSWYIHLGIVHANTGADWVIGQLKAKLAKLKRELLTPTSSGGGAGGKSG